MTIDSDLTEALERAVPRLPSTPAAAYLVAGRRARRRRRGYAVAAGAAVLALTGGAALMVVDEPAPNSLIEPATDPRVEDIPSWAQEYGNHGPISIYPNGDLWVAPEARLLRKIEIPASAYLPKTVTVAYAAESEFEGEVWWTYVVRTSDSPDDKPMGIMEEAGAWTTDFDLWADYASAADQGRTRFSERLVRFADRSSERLVALAGAEIVEQTDELPDLPAFENHPRRSIAEVSYLGKTWFVFANGPRSGVPFYMTYQAEAVTVTDLEGFLDYLDRGVDGIR